MLNYNHLKPLFIATSALLVTACASTKIDSPLVTESEQHFSKVADSEMVKSNAPVAYDDAEKALDKLKKRAKADAEETELKHLAYVSQRESSIAQQQAELSLAEKKISEAEVNRKDMIIALKSQEAEEARRLASQYANQAIDARRQLQLTKEEKARMESLLAEFKAKETERGLVLTLDNILFDLNKATLKPGSERSVEKLADFLREYPERNLLIEGFTDSTGEASYNKELSNERAETIKVALQSLGIDSDRIGVKCYGEHFPVATNETKAGRQLNRRVEIIIAKKGDEVISRN